MTNNIFIKLSEYFFSNITKCSIGLITAFGFLIFWIFYTQENSMPNLDLLSSATVLLFVAVTGLVMFAILFLIFILPGYYWRLYIKSEGGLPKKIIGLCSPSDSEQEHQNRRTFIGLLSLPYTFWSLIITAGLSLTFEKRSICFVLFCLVASLIPLHYSWKQLKGFLPDELESVRGSVSAHYMTSALCAFVSISPFFIIAMTAQDWMKESDILAYLSLLLIWASIVAIMFSFSYQPANQSKATTLLITSGIIVYTLFVYSNGRINS